jgi:hypothetical protein
VREKGFEKGRVSKQRSMSTRIGIFQQEGIVFLERIAEIIQSAAELIHPTTIVKGASYMQVIFPILHVRTKISPLRIPFQPTIPGQEMVPKSI